MPPAWKFLVFDWDGTLADSAARIVQCFHAAIADAGAPERTADECRATIGLSLAEAARRLFPGEDPDFVERFVEAYRDHWLAPEAPKACLFAGARPTLEALRSRGFTLAVATGKSRVGLDRELDECGLRHLFAATRCADETRSKPHPRMLLELLDEARTGPDEALMIGDTTFDLLMARAAGVSSLAATYGAHPVEQLMPHRPLGTLASIDGLLDWLDRGV